jgi:hypothetical protein
MLVDVHVDSRPGDVHHACLVYVDSYAVGLRAEPVVVDG